MKKNSSVDENLRKKKKKKKEKTKKKCFEVKGTIRNAKKNRTSTKS